MPLNGKSNLRKLSSDSRRQFLLSGMSLVGASAVGALLPDLARSQTVAFDYYVSPTGSDSNPGTQNQPWALTSLILGNPNRAKVAGKIVGFLPGTYLTGGMVGTDYQRPLLDIPSGTASAPTVYRSVVPQGAMFDDSGATHAASIFGQATVGGGYFTLDGLVFTNGKSAYVCMYSNGTPSTVAGVTIKNCEFKNLVNSSSTVGSNIAFVQVFGLSGFTFTNNKLHDISYPVDPQHCSCLELWGVAGAVISNNTFYNAPQAIDAKRDTNYGTPDFNIEVKNNYFWGITSTFLRGFDGYPSTNPSQYAPYSVHNNVFDSGTNHTGIFYGEFNAAASTIGTSFFNNTFAYTGTSSIVCLILEMNTAAVYNKQFNVYNNIVYLPNTSSYGYTGAIGSRLGQWLVWDYNDYYFGTYANAFGLAHGGSLYNFSGWQALPGAPDAHSITSDPRFLGSGGSAEAFKLAAGSPCISTGLGGVDMGAWGGTTPPAIIGCTFASSQPLAPVIHVS